MRQSKYILFAFIGLFLSLSQNEVCAKDIFVNNLRLDDSSVYTLENFYKTTIPAGSYWYDNLSGYWGRMGAPAQGQLIAGLGLGGDLPADASNGKTGVFVNGRELHQIEVQKIIQTYGKVYRGRFWLNAQGLAGYEGQPAIFNFTQINNKAKDNSFTKRSLFGSSGGNAECSYYMHPDGASVSNCD